MLCTILRLYHTATFVPYTTLFRSLRRSAIRTFVRAGINEHTAMALSGHKTSSVFRRYDIISEQDLDDAAEKLNLPHGTPARRSEERRVGKECRYRGSAYH